MTRLDVQGLVTTLKRPPGFAPGAVEPCRPRPLQPFHAGAQVWLRGLHREVNVVSHDDKRVQPPTKPLARRQQILGERRLRVFASEDVLTIISAIDHVINRSRELQPQHTRHNPTRLAGRPATFKVNGKTRRFF